jgi:hypothetical protein
VEEFLAFLPSIPVIWIAGNTDAQSVLDSAVWYMTGNSIALAVVTIALLWESRKYFRDWNALFRSANSLKPSAEMTESAKGMS